MTTHFAVQIHGSNSAGSLTTAIAGASTAVETAINGAAAAEDWSNEPFAVRAWDKKSASQEVPHGSFLSWEVPGTHW